MNKINKRISIIVIILALFMVFTNCNEEEKPHEHNYEIWRVEKEATCLESGKETRKCLICGEKEERTIEALGHKEEKVDGFEATCTQNGLTDGVICSRCNEEIVKQEIIACHGHTKNDEWIVDIYPTFDKKGEKSIRCTVCDERIEVEEIPVLVYTKGLNYVLNSTKDGYIITGEVAEDILSITIYSSFLGKPVTEITAKFNTIEKVEVYFMGSVEEWNKLIMKNSENNPKNVASHFYIDNVEIK